MSGKDGLKTARTNWQDIVLVCRKCSRKLDGGFGQDGDQSLDKALKRHLKAGKGRKARIKFVAASCFDICPKRAVVVARGATPGRLYVVPEGMETDEAAARLGLPTDE